MRMPFLICIISIIISVLIDLYIYFDIKKSKKKHSPRFYYLISSLLLLIYLIVIICIPKNTGTNLIAISWMIFSYIVIYMIKLLYIIFSLIGKIPCIFQKKKIRLGLYLGLPIGLLLVIFLIYNIFYTTREIQIRNIEINSDRLPYNFKEKTIVQLSDLHVGTWGNDTTFIKHLVDSVNSLNPDLIVFTGDIVNRNTEELLPFVHQLSRLKAPLGIYSILGNHDYGDYYHWKSENEKNENLKKLIELQNRMGWKLLDNNSTYLRIDSDSIALIGVGNYGKPPFINYGDLEKAYPNLNDTYFKILLSHNPDHWDLEVNKKSNIDLTLSGHTHAMQMIINKWSPASFKYKYWGGLYNDTLYGSEKYLYVNIGAGEVGFPIRLGSAKPEITFITLK